MEENQQVKESKIIFLLKSMKKEYLHDTVTKGRFCFNHPTVFSEWENADAAQFDKWEGYDAYECTHMVIAPLIGEENGKPVYGPGEKLAGKGIIHMQSGTAKHSPICCFRCVFQSDVSIEDNYIVYTLGEAADKIMNEFGHDAYVIIPIVPFLERLKKKVNRFLAMDVAYHDILNKYQFNVDEQYREIVEQLFRKDEKYEWQKEYRIVLPPSKESPVFVEIGSIEDIAQYGSIVDLR